VSVADWALLASVVFSGLWSGLLAMLVLILHRMLAGTDGPGFAHFDVMLAWDPAAPPAGWEAARRRYFALDWIRAAATWIAFALFLAALVQPL
jgi:hypothetical protein